MKHSQILIYPQSLRFGLKELRLKSKEERYEISATLLKRRVVDIFFGFILFYI